VLNPGAGETLAALHRGGRRLAFLSNNSRATGDDLRGELHTLGIAIAEHVLTPLAILGDVIRERWGRSRVLAIGAREMADAIAAAGHDIVDVKDHA
jgi:ribonucleotide monophosphatase NagD (HAD superfamily)